jgi:cytochrome c553
MPQNFELAGIPMFQLVIKSTCALVLLLGGASALAGGDAEAGQAKAATCVACHGVDGNSAVPTFPKLAGLGHKYLLKQMKDIRDGRRPVALMAGQVDNMSDQDLSDIAAFYDAQPRTGRPVTVMAQRVIPDSVGNMLTTLQRSSKCFVKGTKIPLVELMAARPRLCEPRLSA